MRIQEIPEKTLELLQEFIVNENMVSNHVSQTGLDKAMTDLLGQVKELIQGQQLNHRHSENDMTESPDFICQLHYWGNRISALPEGYSIPSVSTVSALFIYHNRHIQKGAVIPALKKVKATDFSNGNYGRRLGELKSISHAVLGEHCGIVSESTISNAFDVFLQRLQLLI